MIREGLINLSSTRLFVFKQFNVLTIIQWHLTYSNASLLCVKIRKRTQYRFQSDDKSKRHFKYAFNSLVSNINFIETAVLLFGSVLRTTKLNLLYPFNSHKHAELEFRKLTMSRDWGDT